MFIRTTRSAAVVAVLLLASAGAASAQTVTTPKQHFGFNIGDDYHLATYDQFLAYWQKLDKESTRVQVIEIGRTEEGRPHLAAIVTAGGLLFYAHRWADWTGLALLTAALVIHFGHFGHLGRRTNSDTHV